MKEGFSWSTTFSSHIKIMGIRSLDSHPLGLHTDKQKMLTSAFFHRFLLLLYHSPDLISYVVCMRLLNQLIGVYTCLCNVCIFFLTMPVHSTFFASRVKRIRTPLCPTALNHSLYRLVNSKYLPRAEQRTCKQNLK